MMRSTDSRDVQVISSQPLSDVETFIAKLGDRDRLNVERHLAACELEETGQHARLWKRMVCALAQLAPHATSTSGQRAVRFYISDGKYRLQLFALEDLRDGSLAVYAADALEAALRTGALRGPGEPNGDAMLFEITEQPDVRLSVESLTAAKTTSAPEYFKHMLGWNRKAVRITLPVDACPAIIRAVLTLCGLAARQQAA